MDREIKSTNNELIKFLIQLQGKSRLRKREGLFVVEGIREVGLALGSDHQFRTFFYCQEIILAKELGAIRERSKPMAAQWIRVSQKVYEHIAHRKTTEGILAIGVTKEKRLEDLELGDKPLILVAEASEKPGNIGALLRTADAAGLDAVLLANPLTDLYNPNIIRSSVGCVFTTQVVMSDSKSILKTLKERGIRSFAAALHPESRPYHQFDYTGASAIVVGTEATGLSEEWLDGADDKIVIPMSGSIDSLNVSVSASVLVFEAKRQRNFH